MSIFCVGCSYIEGDKSLQEEFVMLLDKLCQPGVLARSAAYDRHVTVM